MIWRNPRRARYEARCLKSGLFRDGVQFCSGLVDLVVGVGRQGGGGHRLTLAGERFCLGNVRGGGGWPAGWARWYQEQPLLRRPDALFWVDRLDGGGVVLQVVPRT